MQKKSKAKAEMLRKLSSAMSDEMHSPLKDKMSTRQKVTVIADDAEGLQKGLSKAEQIIKKYKEMKGLSDEEMMDEESEMEDDCELSESEEE